MFMKRREPETNQPILNEALLVEPVTAAHIGQYVVWLEGHLEAGGTPTSYRPVDHVVPFFGLNDWIAGTGFVTSNVSEPNLPQNQFERIIVADGVEDTPSAPTKYYFDSYVVSGFKDVPVFASSEFREFSPLFADSFRSSLTDQLINDANPEQQGMLFGYWPDKRQKTLDEYGRMSQILGIEISEETIQKATAIAVEKRKEQEQIMATPEYQQQQIDYFQTMIDAINSGEIKL